MPLPRRLQAAGCRLQAADREPPVPCKPGTPSTWLGLGLGLGLRLGLGLGMGLGLEATLTLVVDERADQPRRLG